MIFNPKTYAYALTMVSVGNYPGGIKRHPINNLPYHNNINEIIISDICVYAWMDEFTRTSSNQLKCAPSNGYFRIKTLSKVITWNVLMERGS